MVTSGQLDTLMGKIKRHERLYFSPMASNVIANMVHDQLAFSTIYTAYRYIFTSPDAIVAAAVSGNINALQILHTQLYPVPIAFPVYEAIANALLGGHLDVLRYIVENVDLKPLYHPLEATRTRFASITDVTPQHLEACLYLHNNVPKTVLPQIFRDPLDVMGLVNIELFNELVIVADHYDRNGMLLRVCQIIERMLAAPRAADSDLVTFVERVVRNCCREWAIVLAVRPQARELSSTMTPLKETYLSLLGYICLIAPDIPEAVALKRQFRFMIEWNDLELTEYFVEIFGFDAICARGSLAQVKAASQMLVAGYHVSAAAMDSKDLEVLKYLHSHRDEGCMTDRLLKERNMDIIKFIVESQPEATLVVSRSDLAKQERIDVIKYLNTKRCVDIGAPVVYTCSRVDTLKHLIATLQGDELFTKVNLAVTKDADLPIVKMYLGAVDHNSVHFNGFVDKMMTMACKSGLIDIVECLHSHATEDSNRSPTYLDLALEGGHMALVRFILTSMSYERFKQSSWTRAGEEGDIELFDRVLATSTDTYFNQTIEAASIHGHLDLIRHITTKHAEHAKIAASHLSNCVQYDQYHVLDYYLSTTELAITADLVNQALTISTIGCAKTLLDHLPAKHCHANLGDFMNSVPPMAFDTFNHNKSSTSKNQKKRDRPESADKPNKKLWFF
eukprot:gene13654-16078_t